MNKYSIFFAAIFGITGVAECGATWYFAESASTQTAKKYILENSAHVFKLDDMKCGVNETEYLKNSDGSTRESRKLYCWPAKGIYVSTVVTCDFPGEAYSNIFISRNGKSYDPLLTCGPDM